MGYREGYNQKEIRYCKDCRQKHEEMFYVRKKNWHEWFYVCAEHAPIDKGVYSMVAIDNRPGKLR